jgi:isopenicillin N synthase-like dioxygenase
MTLLSVPIVDIAPYWTGGDAGKRAVAAAVDRACRDIGFLIISGHGIPGEMVEETRVLARAFFDLPLAEKMRSDSPRPTSRAVIHRSQARRWRAPAVRRRPRAI